jgi:hypothetical protein
MTRAKKVAAKITDQVDEWSKDLKVGNPALPPWAKGIVKETRIEYFWSELEGWFRWFRGEVVEEPMNCC